MTTTTKSFKKIVRLGKIKGHDLFCKVQFNDGKLSISGVIGPKRNGDAHGSAGQIVMEFKEYDTRGYQTVTDIDPAPGWNTEMIRQFFDAWNQWHLNDMFAGCVHQRKNKWGEETVEIVTYKLTGETIKAQDALKKDYEKRLGQGETVTLTDEQRALLSLPYTTTTAPSADGPGSGCYEVSKREQKQTNWIRPNEHPKGVLGKPCPECGYKYGSAWLTEEVPDDVIAFLAALPNTDVTPAWV